MSNPQIGDCFSFDNGRAFAVSIGPSSFLVIHTQDESDGEPKGSYLVETWISMPKTAERVNIFAENFGGMGITIALAFQAALCALTPGKQFTVYVRPA